MPVWAMFLPAQRVPADGVAACLCCLGSQRDQRESLFAVLGPALPSVTRWRVGEAAMAAVTAPSLWAV